jgi:pyruvate dehydrogenase E2 component (dihydrolipoamide acetyltransferase)
MDVRLPNLGEGADSGSVVSLLVKEGDQVKQGQTLLELENEKAVAPIPSPADGKITAIKVKEGDQVSVGQVVLSLETGAKVEEPSSVQPPPSTSEAEVQPAPEPSSEPQGAAPQDDLAPAAPSRTGFPPPASPSIRKLAKDLGIELSRVRGSERGGRIVLQDVKAYIQRLQQLAFQKAGAPAAKPEPKAEDFSKWGPVEKKPMSSLRKTISQRMTEAWTTIPHVTQFDQADITRLLELRKKQKKAYEEKGASLTLTCFVLKALVEVLKQHPSFNSSLDEAAQQIVFKNYFHIGLAVDTEAGLIVPVIRDVDKKSLLELAKDLSELAQKARDRKIGLEELKGGSFTISNQGGIGGAHFTPIVNKPEAAILGLGQGKLQPAVREGKIEPRTFLPLCLSYDHRVIDGAQAARFMAGLVEALENFDPKQANL